MKTISIQEYTSTPDAFLLVDVRTPAEFAEAHIQGALSQPLDDLNLEALKARAGSRQLVFSCLSGARACRAADQGGTETAVLDGSLQGWEQAGQPVVRSTPKGLPLVRQVHLTVGFINLVAAVLAISVNVNWAWIVAATGAGLLLAGATGFCGLALVLAKMPWNRLPKSTCSCSI